MRIPSRNDVMNHKFVGTPSEYDRNLRRFRDTLVRYSTYDAPVDMGSVCKTLLREFDALFWGLKHDGGKAKERVRVGD